MKKSGDTFYLNVSTDGTGAPKDDFVAFKLEDIESTKNPDGSFIYRATNPTH